MQRNYYGYSRLSYVGNRGVDIDRPALSTYSAYLRKEIAALQKGAQAITI